MSSFLRLRKVYCNDYEIADQSTAQLAIQAMAGALLEGKALTVKLANSSEPSQTATNNIYVKGLPLSNSQQDLERLFSPYGNIIESRILSGISTVISFV